MEPVKETETCQTCGEPKLVGVPCMECDMPDSEPLCTDCGFRLITTNHGLCDYCLEESRRVAQDEMALRDSLEQQFR